MLFQADNPIISPVGVIDVIDRVPRLQNKAAHLKESMKNEIITNLGYAREEGTDHPEISNWTCRDDAALFRGSHAIVLT